MASTTNDTVLFYLPWEFDLLGGVDVVVDRLWQVMERQSPGKAVIGLQDWKKAGFCTDTQGRRFLRMNLPAPEGAFTLRYGVTLLRRLPVLRACLRELKVTTVNIHFPTLNVFPLALLRRFGLWQGRIVLSFHGSDANALLPDSKYWRMIASQTDAVTACSAALARRINDLRLFHQSVKVIHNGIDGDRFLTGGKSIEFPQFSASNSPYILNVGNYVPNKGQDRLLTAFSRIVARFPDLSLVCAGGTDNGSWLQSLRQQAKELGVETRVFFLENLSQGQVASLMCNACCLVHVPHNEAFGLVLIEAGVCGTPVIAMRVGGIPEIISNSRFGVLIENGDIEGLAQAMSALLLDPDKGGYMANEFRQRVSVAFSVESMAAGYFEVING